MKSIYKYYKERLIEISGKNRSLYARKISKKYAYDIGEVIGSDKDEFQEFLTFLWKGKRTGYPLIHKNMRERLYKNFNLEGKVKALSKSTEGMSLEDKRAEAFRQERIKREEGKKIVTSQVNALKNLKREIDEFAKETGRYELFIGYPFVVGKINKDITIKAPLILFPVTINVESDKEVTIEAKNDEFVQFNKVLMLAYAREHRLNTEGMLLEFDNLMDYKLRTVKDVVDYLSAYGYKFKLPDKFENSKLMKFDDIPEPDEIDNLKIVNACVIGRFPLANSIYNDYTLLEKKHLTTASIRELLEAKSVKKKKKKSYSAREALPVALDTIGKLLRRTRRWLYCGRFVLKVNVACEDPAATAELYGLISGQAAVLTRAVLALHHSKRRGNVYCEITPDFLSEAFDAMIDTEFGLRIWQGLALGITALRGFLKIRKSAKKEDDANEQRASTQADH